MTIATSAYLNRAPRTYAQALAQIQFERAVSNLMWEQRQRDRATTQWQRETQGASNEH